MEQILRDKLKEALKELSCALDDEGKYHEKRENIILGQILMLAELLKELK